MKWKELLPEFRSQIVSFDTKSCVVFAFINVIETFTGLKLSDRWTAIKSGANTDGFSPTKVISSIKKYGVVEDRLCPNSEGIFTKITNEDIEKKYFNFKTIKSPLFFWRGKQSIIKALEKSPLAISVFSWSNSPLGYTRPPMFKDNHFVMLYDYKYGKCWYVYDSYEPKIKKLTWDYPFTYVYGIKV